MSEAAEKEIIKNIITISGTYVLLYFVILSVQTTTGHIV